MNVKQLRVGKALIFGLFIASTLGLLGCDDNELPGGGAGAGITGDGDLGVGDGRDVITIGDSWMNLGVGALSLGGIQTSLEKASGRTYRKYGVGGTKLLDGAIPGQYTRAKAEDPDIKTVIMTAGGNDILQDPAILAECTAFTNACKTRIDQVASRLVTLWDQMARDGVRDVVIIGYTRKANIAGLPLADSAEYSNQVIAPLCEKVRAPLRCHALDSDTVFDGSTLEGIHPTARGFDAIGKGVWELMVSEGMRR